MKNTLIYQFVFFHIWRRFLLFFALPLTLSLPALAITAEIHRVSDNGLASSMDFGSISNTGIYAQAAHYLLIKYTPGEEDTDTLKLLTDNPNWIGVDPDRAGLVRTPSPTDNVPVYFTAFGEPQQNVVLSAQNLNSWKNLKDKNDPGFQSYDPAQMAVPLFATGETYIYFAGKMNPNTPAAFYLGTIKVSNLAQQPQNNNNGVTDNGFTAFDGLFRFDQETQIQIPYDVLAPANVTLTIYDRKGAKVKTLVSGDHASGSFAVAWDGKNNDGLKLGSGRYILLLEIGNERFRKNLVIAR